MEIEKFEGFLKESHGHNQVLTALSKIKEALTEVGLATAGNKTEIDNNKKAIETVVNAHKPLVRKYEQSNSGINENLTQLNNRVSKIENSSSSSSQINQPNLKN